MRHRAESAGVELDFANANVTERRVARKRPVGPFFKRTFCGNRVFNRHGCPLSLVWCHRVGCVAEQEHTATSPHRGIQLLEVVVQRRHFGEDIEQPRDFAADVAERGAKTIGPA